MTDMDAFDRLIAKEVVHASAPPRPVDDAAIFTAVTAAQSHPWKLRSVFSAARFVVAGAIVALFGGFLVTSALLRGPDDGQDRGAAAPASAAVVSPTPTDGTAEERHKLIIDGIVLSIAARTGPTQEELPVLQGGEGHTTIGDYAHPPYWQIPDDLNDGLYISRDTAGSQAAEAMILWTTFPGSGHARPCLLDPSAGPSLADLADEVATAPGTKFVSGPADVTVGGRAAKHVVVTVALDAFLAEVSGGARTRTLGCDPGYFFGWKPQEGGMLWYTTDVGAKIDVWFVDLDDRELFLASITSEEADPSVLDEIDAIVGSIRFVE